MSDIAIYTGSRADREPLRYVMQRLGERCIPIQTEGMYGLENEIRGKLEAADADLFVICGDRFESAIAALTAAEMTIPIVHISGGEDTFGAVDNAFRNAITQLADWHCVANDAYAERVAAMGISRDRIFVTGDPQIDALAFERQMTREEIEAELGIALKPPVLLVVFHPETLSALSPEEQAAALVEALKDTEATQIIAGPNLDRGGRVVADALRSYAESRPNAVYRDTYDQTLFVNLMRHCDAMVGNSSAGVIMAPALGKPSVNIGDRQKGRLRFHPIVTDSPFEAVKETLRQVIAEPIKGGFRIWKGTMFGIPGQVSQAIVDKLMTLPIPPLEESL